MNYLIFGVVLLVGITNFSVMGLRLPVYDDENYEEITDSLEDANETVHNLYVIKTMVYEIGILTDVNNTTESNETQQEVSLTFFNPFRNSSFIDLKKISAPIQTNISGQVITSVVPANFGVSSLASNTTHATTEHQHLQAPILPKLLLSTTNNISTSNSTEAENIWENLPAVLGLASPNYNQFRAYN